MARLLTLGWFLACPGTGPEPARQRGAEERKAIALLEAKGVIVKRDEDAPGKPVVEVSCTTASGRNVFLYEETVGPVRAFASLRKLRLNLGVDSDAALARVAGLAELRSLDLGDTFVTDDGLATVKTFPRLRQLALPPGRRTPGCCN
jgi:hypothetical protein